MAPLKRYSIHYPKRVVFVLAVISALFVSFGIDTLLLQPRAYGYGLAAGAAYAVTPDCGALDITFNGDGATPGNTAISDITFVNVVPASVTIGGTTAGCGPSGADPTCGGPPTLTVSASLTGYTGGALTFDWTSVAVGIEGPYFIGAQNGSGAVTASCPVAPPAGTAGTAGTAAAVPAGPPPPTPLPPAYVDPGIAAEQLIGVERVNFDAASLLVVYNLPYGYQFYHAEGFALGLVDFGTVSIPGPLGLIASFTTGNPHYRVDVYYIDNDRVQANLYDMEMGGALIQEFGFDVPGIGARSGGSGLPVPLFPGQAVAAATGATGDGGGTAAPVTGVAEVLCRQNLRQGASIDTAIVTTMIPGATVTVVGRSSDNSWLNVSTDTGLSGWTFNGHCVNGSTFQAPIAVVFNNQPIIDNQGTVVQQPDQAVASAAPGGTLINVICRQNERTGPGTSFTVNRVLEPGTQLSVVGRSADATWLQIENGGWTYRGQCVVPISGDVTNVQVTVALAGG